MLALGTKMPAFSLPDTVSGRIFTESDAHPAHGTLVMFVCNHCPYVIHLRSALVALAHDALDRGFAVYAINSNSIKTHPQDGPAAMKELASSEGWRFPYLFDSTQDVARAYDAACTPDFFLFDRDAELAYRGQFDDSRPGNDKPVTGSDLRAAMDALVEGKAVSAAQRPSIGCNIKWDR